MSNCKVCLKPNKLSRNIHCSKSCAAVSTNSKTKYAGLSSYCSCVKCKKELSRRSTICRACNPPTNWTKENLEAIVKDSYYYAECLRKMGLKVAGGNQRNLVKHLLLFKIDTSHMSHPIRSPDAKTATFKRLVNIKAIRKRLLKESNNTCQRCLNKEWLGKPIPLEVHHINGDSLDNRSENLVILCSNCHRLTPNWGTKNRRNYKV